jgi:dUTP pyrophosphatase
MVAGVSENPSTSIVENLGFRGLVTVFSSDSLTVTAPPVMEVRYKRLRPQVPDPSPAHPGDAAVDLTTTVSVTLEPGERQAVPTGLAVAIPEGYAGLVVPRSGHALRSGIGVVNGPGLIDSGYRGEIKVILVNHGHETVRFETGDRIAQLMVVPVPVVDWVETGELGDTIRGESGFGSTGT